MSILDIARMIANNSTSSPATTSTRYGKAVTSAKPGKTVSVLLDGSDSPVELVTKTAVDKDERVSVVNDGGTYAVLALESVSDGLVDIDTREIPFEPKTGLPVPTQAQHSIIENVVCLIEAEGYAEMSACNKQAMCRVGWKETGGESPCAVLFAGGALILLDGKTGTMHASAKAAPLTRTIIADDGNGGTVYAKNHAGTVIVCFDTYHLPNPPGTGRYEITTSATRLPVGWRPAKRSKATLVTTVPHPVQVLIDPNTGAIELFHADALQGNEISGSIPFFAEQ